MDQGTAAVWGACLTAATALIAIWMNSKSTRRQIEVQRQDADKQRSATEDQLRQQRGYYEEQIREILEFVSTNIAQQQLDREKFDVYREFTSWYFSTFWDWLYHGGDWTSELHQQAISGPQPDTLAALTILAPPQVVGDYERLKKYISSRSLDQITQSYSDHIRDSARSLISDLAKDLRRERASMEDRFDAGYARYRRRTRANLQ